MSSSNDVYFSTAKTDLVAELKELFKEKCVRRIGFLLLIEFLCIVCLGYWYLSSDSMALLAYSYTIGFNIFSLLSSVLSLWVSKQKPSPLYTFGYERFEVLWIFSSTILVQLGALFIVKESLERLFLHQPEIQTGRLLFGAALAFASHIIVIYGNNNPALDHVIAASSSSWLQAHASDISQSICSTVPLFSRLLLPRINPLMLVASAGSFSLVITDLVIHSKEYHVMDSIAAILIALMMCATMFPMCIYTGKVLLQTTPSHVVGQLDKCLREALTLDGVLEFRHEHFWTLSFGRMAGCLQVRVRRDADEQLVLAHVVDRLSSIVSVLTVQVFKDEWVMKRIPVDGMSSSVMGKNFSSLPLLMTAPNTAGSAKNLFGDGMSLAGCNLQNHTNGLSQHVSGVNRYQTQDSSVNPGIQTSLPKTYVSSYTGKNQWPYSEFRQPPTFSDLKPQSRTINPLLSGSSSLSVQSLIFQPQ